MSTIDTAWKRLKGWRDGTAVPAPAYCAGSNLFAEDVIALLARAEAAERERDEARRLLDEAKTLVTTLMWSSDHEKVGRARDRENAAAREAVLRDAAVKAVIPLEALSMSRPRGELAPAMWDGIRAGIDAVRAALASTAEDAAARDARLREEGRREGIEAARVAIALNRAIDST